MAPLSRLTAEAYDPANVFPATTPLREAMFEEPTRLITH